jgi:hypothetical protein
LRPDPNAADKAANAYVFDKANSHRVAESMGGGAFLLRDRLLGFTM